MKTTLGNWVRPALLLAAVLGVKSAPGEDRIVGGQSVDIKYFPHQVSLQYDGQHFCGASIICKDWALTAGHCSISPDVSRMTIRAGSSIWNSGGTVYNITSMTRHPYYTILSTEYDIALVKVSRSFVLRTGVQAIALPVANTIVAGLTEATVSGWGFMNVTATTIPSKLRAVDVNIVDLATCQKIWRTSSIPITDTMICAGGRSTGGIGACMGDTGGPLVVKIKRVKQLVGVVSFIYPCALPTYPGIYARVANPIMRNWIKATSGV